MGFHGPAAPTGVTYTQPHTFVQTVFLCPCHALKTSYNLLKPMGHHSLFMILDFDPTFCVSELFIIHFNLCSLRHTSLQFPDFSFRYIRLSAVLCSCCVQYSCSRVFLVTVIGFCLFPCVIVPPLCLVKSSLHFHFASLCLMCVMFRFASPVLSSLIAASCSPTCFLSSRYPVCAFIVSVSLCSVLFHPSFAVAVHPVGSVLFPSERVLSFCLA